MIGKDTVTLYVTDSVIQVSQYLSVCTPHRSYFIFIDIMLVDEEPGKVKNKHTHQEIIGAFDMIQSFMEDEKLPLEKRLALDRLRYGVQMHQMRKPKASPTIRNFFQPIHKV